MLSFHMATAEARWRNWTQMLCRSGAKSAGWQGDRSPHHEAFLWV